jgi:large subunit ribosomal protein L19
MLRKALEHIEKKHVRTDLPDFRTGDTVRVHTRIKEGDKERIQVFEGVVIAHGRGATRAMFTVRKVSYGVGVERMFPVHSPRIERVEVVSRGEVRRARLYYLRELQGKAARLSHEEGRASEAEAAAPVPAAPPAPAAPQE